MISRITTTRREVEGKKQIALLFHFSLISKVLKGGI